MAISSAEPGSWAPNWLQGTPTTLKPLPSNRFWISSRPVYWGVSPHCEATFTSRTALPS